jgi:toxin YoeB
MRNIAFEKQAFEQVTEWAAKDRKIYAKIGSLIADTLRNPFAGIGKPRPLKHDLKGCWSRRITDEHRLVYKVTDDLIIVLSCKFHYE